MENPEYVAAATSAWDTPPKRGLKLAYSDRRTVDEITDRPPCVLFQGGLDNQGIIA